MATPSCPRCLKALSPIPFRGRQILACENCAGHWIAGDLKAAILLSSTPDDPHTHTDEGYLDCPSCGSVTMERVHYPEAPTLIIDHCGQCEGLWMDGERAGLLAATLAGEPPPERLHDRLGIKEAAHSAAYNKDFWSNVPLALTMPLKPTHLAMLGSAAVLEFLCLTVTRLSSNIPLIGPGIGGFIGTAIVFFFLLQALKMGANGRRQLLDLNDFKNFTLSVIVPLLRFTTALAIVFAPVLVVVGLMGDAEATSSAGAIAVGFVVMALLPVIVTILALTDGFLEMVNPFLAVKLVKANPTQFLAAAGIFEGILALSAGAMMLLTALLGGFGELLGLFVQLILSVAAFQIMGLYAHSNWEKL